MELRVRFAETDQMRVAHHAAYVVWLEAARVEWLRSHGLRYRDLEDAGVSLAVAGLRLRYGAAARFDDLLRIDVTLVEVRSRRLTFDYRIVRVEDDPAELAAGDTIHVPTDVHGRAVRLPGAWREAVGRLVTNVAERPVPAAEPARDQRTAGA